MALIVEDGTGVSGANAYISRADFLTYHAERNNAGAAALATTVIDAAILYATEYLDSKYQWRGKIVSEDQYLGLPTEGGYDDQGREISGLPDKVPNACAEVAYIHSQTPLTASLGPRVVENEVVGAVRQRFSDQNGNEGTRYPFIDRLLKGLYISGGVQFLESMGS